MNAQNFFGYTTGSSTFDGRRHVNFFFVSFIDYQCNIDIDKVKYIKEAFHYINVNELNKSYKIIKRKILTSRQIKFLDMLKKQNSLSDDEYDTILSGIGLTTPEIRTPAGYDKRKNITMFIQCVLATAFMQPQIPQYTQEYYDKCFSSFSMFLTMQQMMLILNKTQEAASHYRFIRSIIRNYTTIETKILSELKFSILFLRDSIL